MTRRMLAGMTVALAAVACGGVGGADEASAPTEEASVAAPAQTPSAAPDAAQAPGASPATIVGTWQAARDTTFRFNADGTYDAQEGRYEHGTYELDGTTLVLVPDEESFYCSGDIARYGVSFRDDGDLLAWSALEDDCAERAETMRLARARRITDET